MSAHDTTDDDEDATVERSTGRDLDSLMSRRRVLLALGGTGLGAVLAACSSSYGRDSTGSTAASTQESAAAAGSAPPASAAPATAPPTAGTVAPATAAPAATAADDTTASAETGSTEPASTEAAECVGQIPEETAGPFPGDGTNGANVLTEDGVVRSDITSSFGSSTTTADGVPLGLVLTVQDAASCTPLAGAAVYAWHCDAAGDYSLYSDGVTGENYLRGVQETDANGQVRFTSIFPGCYSGRWPHVHFEIYDSLSSATSGANSIATSQLAFPQDACESVYADARYPQSVSNLAQLSLATDNVFADDGGMHQLATMTGSDAGYTASLTIGV